MNQRPSAMQSCINLCMCGNQKQTMLFNQDLSEDIQL